MAIDNIPILHGRRTLLIGLGSTGAKICNQILERLIWTYDSPASVPWIKTIVIETAPVKAELAVRKFSTCLHTKVERDDYANLIQNPQNYNPTMAFPIWNIPRVTKDGGVDAVTDGADNVRVIGRLAFLFPSNFLQIREAIKAELEFLAKMTAQEASSSYSEALGEPIHVDLAQENGRDAIYVYVVGTLCGGTASGCFIDLGYLLQEISGYNLSTTAIVLLPSTAEGNDIHVGNAYASLMELNHYSSDRSKYGVQFPHTPNVPWPAPSGARPYRYLYLAQCAGSSAQDYARLITASADYVFSDALGTSATDRDGKRADISALFVQRDYWGATQKFMTFGLSSIEFPYTKVAKACALRLARKGFQELMNNLEPTQTQLNTMLLGVPLADREKLTQRLLRRGAHSLMGAAGQVLHVRKLETDAAMSLAREQLDAAFSSDSTNPHPSLPSRVVPLTVDDNTRPAASELEESIKEQVREALQGDEPYGLPVVTAFLGALEQRIADALENRGAVPADQVVGQLATAVNTSQQLASECRRDFWIRILMLRGPAVRRYVKQFVQRCSSYFDQRLRQACQPACQTIYTEALELIHAIQRRIVDPGHPEWGLRPDIDRNIAGLNGLYARTDVSSGVTADGWTRTINGAELFTAGQTIEEEYWACLNRELENMPGRATVLDVEREYARNAVREYVTAAVGDEKNAGDLFQPPNRKGRLDYMIGKDADVRDPSDQYLLDLARPARAAFRSLKDRTILDRLMNRPDFDAILEDANSKSKVFLDWQAGHPRYHDHPNKSYGFAFYNGSDPRAAQFQAKLVEARIVGGRTQAINTADQHQVLILREQGAFSLGTVDKLKDEDQSSFWKGSYLRPRIPSLHSRGDISRWITWARENEEERVRNRSLFLTGVALGEIDFVSATEYRFEYEPASPVDPGCVILSNDLDKATGILAEKGLDGQLRIRINERRKGHAAEVVDQLIKFIKESNNKFTESEQRLSAENIQVYLLDYITKDSELAEQYRLKFKNPVELSYIREDEYGIPAYYCPAAHCQNKLGYTSDSLYVTETAYGVTRRVRLCSYCGTAL